MPHVLSQVRAAAVLALSGATPAGANVFVQEPYPWAESQLPALLVMTSSSPVSDYMDGEPVLRWDVTLDVMAVLKGTGDLITPLDDIATAAQAALAGLVSVGGRAVQVIATNVEAPTVDGSGDQPVARRTVSFLLQSLYTPASAPDSLLD
jgi:hypothetical protein